MDCVQELGEVMLCCAVIMCCAQDLCACVRSESSVVAVRTVSGVWDNPMCTGVRLNMGG